MGIYIIIGIGIVIIILLVILLVKSGKNAGSEESRQAVAQIDAKLNNNLNSMIGYVGNEFERNRRENSSNLKEINDIVKDMQDRNEQQSMKINNLLNESIRSLQEKNENQSEKINNLLNESIQNLQEKNEQHSEKISKALRESVQNLQESNEKKLDEMRNTVNEKLDETLTKRLDSSFKIVGDQLKNVHETLGEMHKLAGNVNDLQRVLTNVKSRGTWAEVQLENILEQTLTKDQYDCNVSTKKDNNRVEFAVRIPSRDDDGKFVWLPIDSKFPQEDYIRICDAAEKADKEAMDAATKALEATVKKQAKTIADLYINVPDTTDFAIMFLATEGLYAEVLRRPGLCEEIQNKYRIMICGPTTITAFLNTLRVGFRTIALDKKAAEVWKILGAARTQYDKFEDILAKVKKKLDEASSSIEDAQKRNEIIDKKLKSIEKIETGRAEELLGIEPEDAVEVYKN